MEHLLGHIVLHSDNEVPPHTRGTLHNHIRIKRNLRITPACGEHPVSYLLSSSLPGSPPLTRGTRSYCSRSSQHLRITPAYAGNTVILQSAGFSLEDHPRLRGEHSLNLLYYSNSKGSPPLTRGTQQYSQ